MNKLCQIDHTLKAVRSELLDGMEAGFGMMSIRSSGTAIPNLSSVQFEPRQHHPVGSGTNLPSGSTQPSPAIQWPRVEQSKTFTCPHPRPVAWLI